ncbi:MAG TPA: phenylalanine--tRNA ligase subunit beta, partial [Chthonomonadaceae bacterium]|nr:phenylalanine--tRNA ligase subunit beta [Chthonomonadaceae bacterium]
HTLNPPMLVIADAEKAVALAGIMGGEESEVSDTTTNLLLESAHFAPLSVRRTLHSLDMRATEASYRFERVVDPEGVRRAVDRACQLLAEIGRPEAVAGVVDIYPHPTGAREVKLRVTRAAMLLGMELTSHICADCLRALGFEVTTEPHGDTDTLRVLVPSYRTDILLEEDLIEEVGRIYGYENIPETLPFGDTTQGGDSREGYLLMQIKRQLVECGLTEVVTHSLTPPPAFDNPADLLRRVPVRNALSAEISGLRRSLIPTLLDVAQHNATHGKVGLGIFEVGRVWQNEGQDGELAPAEYIAVGGLIAGSLQEAGWQKEAKTLPADYPAMRGILDNLLCGLGIHDATLRPIGDRAEALPQFHPGRSATISLQGGRLDGVIGEIHPRVADALRLRDRVYVFELSLDALRRALPAGGPRYHPLSSYPTVLRDLAPHVPETLPYAEVEAALRGAGVAFLEDVRLTDVYRGAPLPEGVKSLTLSFTFRAPDRTLNEGDISDALARLRSALESRCQARFPA